MQPMQQTDCTCQATMMQLTTRYLPAILALSMVWASLAMAQTSNSDAAVQARPTLTQELSLTRAETAFLQQHSRIRVHNETGWAPYNYYTNGQASGYSIDYMNLLASKVGLSID